MNHKKTFVRASDIGSWTYCNRAWWLSTVHRVPHHRPQVLAQGTHVHEAHGNQVSRAARLRQVGMYGIVMALLLSGLALVVWVLQTAPF